MFYINKWNNVYQITSNEIHFINRIEQARGRLLILRITMIK